jgi:OmpA-OmpF porin, OOP family
MWSMRNGRFALPGLALVAVMAMPSTAGAQPRPNAVPPTNGDGFDTHLFRPALDSRGFLSVNGVDVLRAGRVSVGLVLDYGRGLLRAPDVGQASTTLVNDSFTGTFAFNYGIADHVALGVSAPVIMMSGDEQFARGTTTPVVAGWGPQALDAQSFQHLAFHGKVKLTPADGDLGIALAAQVGVPVSDAPRNAAADPSIWYWPMVILEKRFGQPRAEGLRIAVNAGYRGHSSSTTTLDLDAGRFRDGSRITYGAGASIRVAEPLDVVVETYGTYLLSDSAAAVKPSNEALLGIKLFVERSSYLVVGAGPGYTGGFEAADLRGVVGFIFEPPVADRDGDGIRDDEDDCPTVYGVRAGSHHNGCPQDTDGDGIPDVEDACPYVKGVRTNDPKTNGCPADDDGDGTPNVVDACPQVPGIHTNDPKTNGCPPIPDRDNDGVPDAEDACPDHPGARHPDPKRNGCPDVLFGDSIITVFDPILFKTGSAEILPESNPTLDKVATGLNAHLDLTLIEVAGHADERGAEQMNLALTQARVESVMHALAARDVAPSRLRAKGYGFYCPRDEGHDEKAWSKNRRVEFLIVKTDRGPTNVPLGCPTATGKGVKPDAVP